MSAPHRTTLRVEGMTCGHCVRHVRSALEAIGGVEDVDVDLAEGRARIDADRPIDPAELLDAVVRAGYRATVAS